MIYILLTIFSFLFKLVSLYYRLSLSTICRWKSRYKLNKYIHTCTVYVHLPSSTPEEYSHASIFSKGDMVLLRNSIPHLCYHTMGQGNFQIIFLVDPSRIYCSRLTLNWYLYHQTMSYNMPGHMVLLAKALPPFATDTI